MSGAIHRLPIPTPFAVGRVNCYLLIGEPLTLVDTGPNSGTSLDTLERMLAEHGVRIEDLELVVLTHQHMDHEGLLEIVARRSGAQVAAFAPLEPWLADHRASATADDTFAQAVMRRHGVPEEVNTVLGVVAAAYRAYGSRAVVSVRLHDGDGLTLGGQEWSVHHRPGHSPSDLVFREARGGTLIGGDHLLGHISSNALVSRPLTGEASPRPQPLVQYIASLEATREMELREVLPGHGDPVLDYVALIDERLSQHERRAAKILGLLRPGPLTAHQIALQMWGEVAVTQAYLTLSEVLGHLDLLVARDAVTEFEDEAGVARFRAL
ncbi:MAG: MBL fold metallo-hydrolase [Solirubrobacteraceae bacterium]